MANWTANPYIYGRPVRGEEFINRSAEVRYVLGRIRNKESTAIIGEPHIGKTSFLLRLGDGAVHQSILGEDLAHSFLFNYVDFHEIASDYTPVDFWEDAFDPLNKKPGSHSIAELLENGLVSAYTRRSLQKIFGALSSAGRYLVLLMDEFEVLLKHPNFQDASFFALLRSLSTTTGGLILVPASRLSIEALNELGGKLRDTGSPLFNHLVPVYLKPFDDEHVKTLLERAHHTISADEQRLLKVFAGRHPYLVQAAASALLEAEGELHKFVEVFYERATPHFRDLWNSLDHSSRTIAVILALLQLGGKAFGDEFNVGEIERVDRFSPELKKLSDRGLAEQIQKAEGKWLWDWEHILIWRGERWMISSLAFAWWIRDVIISEGREIPSVEEWLRQKRFLGMLTQTQWDILSAKSRQLGNSLAYLVESLPQVLVNSLLGRA
jgi:hypothetical protein